MFEIIADGFRVSYEVIDDGSDIFKHTFIDTQELKKNYIKDVCENKPPGQYKKTKKELGSKQ